MSTTAKKTAKKRTRAKSKNPLYVVKGKNVEPANGLFDLIVKKLNLTWLVSLLESAMVALAKEARSYKAVEAVAGFIEQIVTLCKTLLKQFSLA